MNMSMTFRSLFTVVFFLSRACLLSCESNEIPLDDCSDCSTLKTEIITNSKPAWKDKFLHTTASTKAPDHEAQLHSTELVGTTNVVTRVVSNTDADEATSEPGIETIKPKGYTTQTVKPTENITEKQKFTTKAVPTAFTSQENKITTKSIARTENSTEVDYDKVFSPLYTGTFEVVDTDSPITEAATTVNDVTTKGATTPIIEVKVETTEAEVETTKAEVETTKAEVVTTRTETATTAVAPTTSDTGSGDSNAEMGSGDEGNAVDDTMNVDPEFCVDPDTCYNGGESVCERNGGEFLYCICPTGFDGTYCEQSRTVAKVDVSDTRGQGGFWDWKLSKYIIGGLGALTVIGLIMLTCMVVKCVRSGKEDRRRTKEYNTVGLETFIPPAPVVQSTLTAAAMDRGSSDVMDERSEEEFPLHDSDTELGDGPVHVHRRHHHYPDPEDDGLLHHAPSHRAGPSPDHYNVPTPTQHREYMNMNGKQNGTAPYMNGHHIEDPKHSPYMNGSANTYSHKLSDKNTDQYAHLNRGFSKNAQPQHQYLNLP